MNVRFLSSIVRFAVAGMLAACVASGFSQTAQILSPAADTHVTPGTDVSVVFSVSGFNFGINTITVTGQGDPYGSNVYTFPYSAYQNNYADIATYTIPLSATQGQTLTVNLSATGWADETAYASINLIADTGSGTAPANNNFANATLITGASGTLTATNTGANKETSEPYHAGFYGGKSVWWKWTSPASKQVTFSTAGSGFDTLLAAYTGSSVSSLTLIASNDEYNYTDHTSQISFNAVSGTTYYTAVDGYSGAAGSITLGWNQQSDPVAAADSGWSLYE